MADQTQFTGEAALTVNADGTADLSLPARVVRRDGAVIRVEKMLRKFFPGVVDQARVGIALIVDGKVIDTLRVPLAPLAGKCGCIEVRVRAVNDADMPLPPAQERR